MTATATDPARSDPAAAAPPGLRAGPGPVMGVALVAGLVLAAALATLWLALAQPWIGLSRVVGPSDGPGIGIAAVDADGPAAGLRGARLLEVVAADGTRIALAPEDALEEPDALPTAADMAALYARQGALHAALSDGPVTLVTDAGALEARAAPTRPLGALPGVFWLQMAIAVVIGGLGGWTVALRPRDPAVWLFGAAGAGLSVCIFAAAFYSTREVALPERAFALASNLNLLGSLAFGACMTALFLIYPRRLVPLWAAAIPLVVFGLWYLANPLGLVSGRATGGHLATAVEMGCMVLGLAAQLWAARRDPKDRAIVLWFGASVVFGAGGFIALLAIPSAMGYQPEIRQGHAFLLFLFVYAGLAVGVARFRMFDLGDWAFGLLFYGAGVALLFAIDAALISMFAVDAVPAFSASLLLVVLLYLPLRDLAARALRRGRDRGGDLTAETGAVALAPDPAARAEAFEALLRAAFAPLSVEPAPAPVAAPVLRDEGTAMDVPGVDGTGALRLHWTRGGRRLYAPADAERAARLLDTVAQLSRRAAARDRAVAEERARINRDVHDNVGVQLLGALHSDAPDRKNALIRQTIADLREIVSGGARGDVPLRDVVADLRSEIGELFDAAGVALDWSDAGVPDALVSAPFAGGLRAVLREGASNVLRHADASRAWVEVAGRGDDLRLTVADDGAGVAPHAPRGNGLGNMALRAEALGGRFDLGPGADGRGTRLAVTLPLRAAAPLAMAGA